MFTEEGEMVQEKSKGIVFLLILIILTIASPLRAQSSPPKVVEIEIQGNEYIKEKEIKKVIKSEVNKPLSLSKIREDLQAIYEMGFFSPDIQVFKEEVEGGIRLIFKVKENPKITEIELKGLEGKEEKKILSSLSFKKGDLWNFKKIEESKEHILQFYREEGFPFVRVKISKILLGERECKVLLEVEKGEKFFVSEIEIKGNEVIPASRIREVISPKEGEIFVSKTLNNSLETLKDIYGERGYLYVWVKAETEKKDSKMKIIILIEEGPQVKVGKIKIEGNKISKERVFKHNLLLKEGDIFNTKKLRESWRKLYNLGFFEKVEMMPLSTSSPEVLDLLVRVEEKEHRGDLSLGTGYNKESGWEGFLNYSRDNLGGEGKKLEANWKFGKEKNTYNLGYLDRWWRDTSTQLSLKLYNQKSTYPEKNYLRINRGGNIELAWPLNNYIRCFLALGDEKEIMEKINEEEDLPEGIVEGEEIYRTIKMSLERDTRIRDEGFLAFRGSYNLFSLEEGGGLLGGTQDFTKYQGETRSYLRKGNFWKLPVLALRLQGGWGRNLPSEKKFKIGGQDTLRGYKDNEFEGDRKILGSLEIRFPLSKGFTAVLFVDSGNVWGKDSPPERFRTGWGIGLRINTPLGLIRLDYGIGEEGKEFHFGMGEGF